MPVFCLSLRENCIGKFDELALNFGFEYAQLRSSVQFAIEQRITSIIKTVSRLILNCLQILSALSIFNGTYVAIDITQDKKTIKQNCSLKILRRKLNNLYPNSYSEATVKLPGENNRSSFHRQKENYPQKENYFTTIAYVAASNTVSD